MKIAERVYTASVSYKTPDGMRHVITRIGFTDSQDALNWIVKKFSKLMAKWYDIDENGLRVIGEIKDEDESFDEVHVLQCGL